MDKLAQKWTNKNRTQENENLVTNAADANVLGFQELGTLTIVMLGGIISSLILLVLEYVVHKGRGVTKGGQGGARAPGAKF